MTAKSMKQDFLLSDSDLFIFLFSFIFFSFAAVGYLSIISKSPEINLLIKLGRVPRVCLSKRAEVKVRGGRGGGKEGVRL